MHRSTQRPNTQTTAKGCARQTTLSEGPRQYEQPRAECAIWRLLGALSSRISLRAVLGCALLVVRAQMGKAWPAPAHGAAGPKGQRGQLSALVPASAGATARAGPSAGVRSHCLHSDRCSRRECALALGEASNECTLTRSGARGQRASDTKESTAKGQHEARRTGPSGGSSVSTSIARNLFPLQPPRGPLEGRRNGRTTSCSVQSTSSRRSRPTSPS